MIDKLIFMSTTMRRYLLLVLTLPLLLGLSSCMEDEFFEPATLQLAINMENSEIFADDNGNGKPPFEDELEFEAGELLLTSIEFDGERENNDNHYFSRDFSNILVANLEEGELNQQVTFDIPQGSYNHIRLTLHTGHSDSLSGLRFRGMWKFEGGGDLPGKDPPPAEGELPVEIRFFEQTESIPLNLKTRGGNQQIVFNQDNWETLEISLNLTHLFRYFTPGKMRQAAVQGSGNNKKIIISSRHNQELYYNLAERVERSMRAVVK